MRSRFSLWPRLSTSLVRKIKVWRLGQPEMRTDKIGTRLWGIVEYVFLQIKILREKLPGITHFFLFWGFGVLFVGTALIVIQEDFTLLLFDVRFWYGAFYKWYSLALDLFGLFALIAIIVFAVIRYIVRPKRLDNKPTDAISLALIFLILATGFINEGLRMAATEVSTNPKVVAMSEVLAGAGDKFLREVPELTDDQLIEKANENSAFKDTPITEENVYLVRNGYYYDPNLAMWSPVGLTLANVFQLDDDRKRNPDLPQD